MRSFLSHNQGIALLIVLLLVSIATIIAVSLVKRQWVDIRKTQNTLHIEQSWLYAQGVDAWASARLKQDIEKNRVDSEHDEWGKPIVPTKISEGELSALISDAQGRFNINNLLVSGDVGNQYVARFKRLLSVLQQSQDIVNPLLDWLDKDGDIRHPTGAEDNHYLSQEPPYRSANQPLSDISELRLVKGFSKEVYQVLEPHVIALPNLTLINVNTATVPVLRSLAKNLSEQDAQAIVDARAVQAFQDVESFLQHQALAGLKVSAVGLGVSSRYFVVNSRIQVDHLKQNYQSLLLREGLGNIRVVQRIRRGFVGE